MARKSKSPSISKDRPTTPAKRSPVPKLPKAKLPTAVIPPSSPIKDLAEATAPPLRKSQIPTFLQFPIVVITAFSVSALLFSFIAEITAGDLASISRRAESWQDVAFVLGWKVVVLAICWFGGFDFYDTLSFSLLLSTPQSILLSNFYNIRPTTLILTSVANAVSESIPFALLRPLAPSHHASTAGKGEVRNRPILTDTRTTIAISLLATGLLAVTLQLAFATFLPTFLITRIVGIRSFVTAHLGSAGLPALVLALIPAGYAAREFLFVSSTGAPVSVKQYTFDPSTSGFLEHVHHNVWGWYNEREKALAYRTTLLALMVMGETLIQCYYTVKGVEFEGALGYAAVWGAGIVLIGSAFGWVGEPSS